MASTFEGAPEVAPAKGRTKLRLADRRGVGDAKLKEAHAAEKSPGFALGRASQDTKLGILRSVRDGAI
jgi:hypothetical protein